MNRISLRVFQMLGVCLLIATVTTACVLAVRPVITSLSYVGAALPEPSTSVVGTVTYETAYRERAFPMSKSMSNTRQMLMIQLVDLSATTGPPVVMGQEIIYLVGGSPPYEFAIDYDLAAIRSEGVYAVRAELTMEGRALFESPAQPVLLQVNTPAKVVLVLKAVDLQRSTGMPIGIERLARFSY